MSALRNKNIEAVYLPTAKRISMAFYELCHLNTIDAESVRSERESNVLILVRKKIAAALYDRGFKIGMIAQVMSRPTQVIQAMLVKEAPKPKPKPSKLKEPSGHDILKAEDLGKDRFIKLWNGCKQTQSVEDDSLNEFISRTIGAENLDALTLLERKQLEKMLQEARQRKFKIDKRGEER